MASLVRRLLDRPATHEFLDGLTHSGPSYQPTPLPRRGDHVEAWLKQQRDAAADYPQAYDVTDGLLDLYRLHADTRTPLDQHCCEGGNVDDCAGCYDAAHPEPLVSDTEIQARLAQAHAEVVRRKETHGA